MKRYRAVITDGSGGTLLGSIKGETLHPTRDRALKEATVMAVKKGIVTVEEVEVRQKVKREWVEREAEPEVAAPKESKG